MSKTLIFHIIRLSLLAIIPLASLILSVYLALGRDINNSDYFGNWIIYLVMGLSWLTYIPEIVLFLKNRNRYMGFFAYVFEKRSRQEYIVEVILFLLSALGFILIIAMLLTQYSTDILLLALFLVGYSLITLAYPYFIADRP